MTSSKRTLAALAARSHGVFTRAEAFSAGLSRHELDDGLASGRYESIYEGVYVHSGAPKTLAMYQTAACKWAGTRAALSHRSALEEWELAGIKAGRIELTTVGRRCKTSSLIVHRTDYLPPSHIRRRRGRPVTDVARTLFDAGSVVSERTVRAAVIDGIQRKHTTRKELLGRLIEHGGRGRRGCGVLRRVLD